MKSRRKSLSFIIQPDGEIVPVQPEGEEFSPRQMREYVGGTPEFLCHTHDGFFLFHSKEAHARGSPPNDLAAAMYLKRTQVAVLAGRVFLAHPDYVPASWKEIAADRLRDLAARSQIVC